MKTILVFLFFWLVASCPGRAQSALCPRHVETPPFPPLARMAHISGKVVLSVTIDVDGHVIEAKATNRGNWVPLLGKSAIDNVRRWTFARPPTAGYREKIVYDYEFDPSLPLADGTSSSPAITKVTFDLPDRVTIVSNLRALTIYEVPYVKRRPLP